MIIKFKQYIKENNNQPLIISANIPVPDDIRDINSILKNHNKNVYVVGGAVRDFIRGKTPHDYDLVTNARPNEIIDILSTYYKLNLQGKQFGVIRVFTEQTPEGIEIASFRYDISRGRDNKSEGPKVDVENATIIDDIFRRDLTCNALIYDINKKQIIDYVGGINDIKNNIIRTVGKPKMRFDEDRLRILRTIRQLARSNSKLDKKTKNAIIADNRLHGISDIDDVSHERILSHPNGEFNKMLDYAAAHNDMNMFMYYLQLLKELNMFKQMFPDVDITIPKEDLPSFKIELVFAILMQNNPTNKDFVNYLVLKLKMPRNIVKAFIYLTNFKNKIKNIGNVVELAKDKKRYAINNTDLITYCKFMNIDKQYYQPFIKYYNDGFKTSGEEIMKLGFKGKEIADEIKRREINNYKKNYLYI